MSYENKERRRSESYFRTTMDIGMGLFYTIIGTMLLYANSFAGVAIPKIVAYVLGAMMVIGGLFRLYRGLKVILPAKNSRL